MRPKTSVSSRPPSSPKPPGEADGHVELARTVEGADVELLEGHGQVLGVRSLAPEPDELGAVVDADDLVPPPASASE